MTTSTTRTQRHFTRSVEDDLLDVGELMREAALGAPARPREDAGMLATIARAVGTHAPALGREARVMSALRDAHTADHVALALARGRSHGG